MSQWRSWSPNLAGIFNRSVRGLALFLLGIYRSTFSGLVGGVCRFQPTCSQYAKTAFEIHPPVRALGLTLKRLLKCHPLGPFGYDPVPDQPRSQYGGPLEQQQ